MSVKKIEIVPWVKFNAQGVKDELEALAQSCISKWIFFLRLRINMNFLYLMQR